MYKPAKLQRQQEVRSQQADSDLSWDKPPRCDRDSDIVINEHVYYQWQYWVLINV